MISTSKEIRAAIRELWPNVGLLWLPDGTYFRTTVESTVVLLQTSGIASIPRKGEKWDCDEYAEKADLFIKEHDRDDETVLNPRAFGFCFCSKLKGRKMAHTLNILYAPDGLWFIEPQGYHYWPANKEMDHVETVKM